MFRWGTQMQYDRMYKFNEGYTKFCEWCTKGSKLRSEVGIGPMSLPYGFKNEIMDHPCLDGGPRSNRIRCTKFCEGCTKDSKVRSNVGIDTQLLPYGFQNEIIDHKCKMGLPKTIGSNVPNFVKDVPRVPKCVSRWGSATNHFLMGSQWNFLP